MKPELLALPKYWAILPSELEKIKSQAGIVDEKQYKAFFENESDTRFVGSTFFINGPIAFMSISGIINPKLTFWSWLFGGTGLDVISRDFGILLEDRKVEAIVLDIDSPGGSVHCVQEVAEMIFNAREIKPIIAASSTIMTSAGYWIGSAAEKVFVTDEAVLTGSIGVIATHIDFSEFYKNVGIKITEIVAGDKKNVTSPNMPLSKEGEEVIQGELDFIYGNFISNVAQFRGVSDQVVREGMADGQVFLGSQAVEAGLVDEVLSSDEILTRVNAEISKTAGNSGNFFRGESMSLFKKAKGEVVELTADMVKEGHTAVFDQIFAMGKESGAVVVDDGSEHYNRGLEEGKKLGAQAGAQAERERILAIEEQSLPGHEALIEEMKADGVTSGPQAAVKVLQAEKEKKKAGLTTLYTEAQGPINQGISQADESSGGETKKDFKVLVSEYQEEHKCSKTDAMKAIAKSHPEEHAAYNKAA